jgi:hypothetical protein
MSVFLISFFGFIINIRFFSAIFSRFHLEKKNLTRFFYLLLIFDLFVITISDSALVIWLWNAFIFFLIQFSPRVMEFWLEKRLRDITVTILDQIILSIQTGTSLRSAIKITAEREKGWIKYELLKAHSAFFISDDPAPLKFKILQELFDEFKWIDHSRAKTLDQLKNLRWHYKILEDFRRKSGQVSQQAKTQAVVVTFLFVALLIFNICHFGFYENIRLIFFASFLFSVGLILIFILGRRFKWKV